MSAITPEPPVISHENINSPSALVVPKGSENTGEVVETIDNNPIPPNLPEDVLKEVAESNASHQPGQEEQAPDLSKEIQHANEYLRDLGKLLLTLPHGDQNLLLITTALAAGPTQMGLELKQGAIKMVLSVPHDDLTTDVQKKELERIEQGAKSIVEGKKPFEKTEFARFLRAHGRHKKIHKEIEKVEQGEISVLDMFVSIATGADGKALADDLSKELQWEQKQPPMSAAARAKILEGTQKDPSPDTVVKIEDAMRQQSKSKTQEIMKKVPKKALIGGGILLAAFFMLSQFAQEQPGGSSH